MNESRTKKTSRNILIGFICKFVLLFFAFASKTAFVRILGAEYNGINGLYTNLLSVLSLVELGVGNVLSFSLYKAIKQNDKQLIHSIINSFKKIYMYIAIAIAVIGCMLTPVLKYIISSNLSNENLILYYLLYLLNTVVSYVVVYRTTLLVADQKYYISNLVHTGTMIFMYLVQIIYLFLEKNFLGYLIIQVICTCCGNFILNRITLKQYPFLKHNNLINISNTDKIKLRENVQATFIYKVAGVLLNSTDYILISILVGTIYVGYYSNYYVIVTYVNQFIGIFISSVIASIGNLNAENNDNKSYDLFGEIIILFQIIAIVTSCCYWNCLQGFMKIWLGEENVQSVFLLIAIIINNYYNTAMNPVWMFRETVGLFKEVKNIVIITAILNVAISYVLGYFWRTPGILIATTISRFICQFWLEPKILYKKIFKRNPMVFYRRQFRGLVIVSISIILSNSICSFWGGSLLDIVIKAILSSIIAVLCVSLVYCKTMEWQRLINRIHMHIYYRKR
jgi:O-antigen/teichoic acid export membrane protein